MTATNAERITSDTERALAHGPNGDEVNSKVPFHMRDSLHVPAERYYSREFFELEKEKLWPHVWQMAAREEELPEPGDFVEYEIVGQSIVLVRQQDGSVKAFHNACRHRATQLASGTGRFPGNQIVCPFHGWRWNTDGKCSHVFGRDGFTEDVLQPADLALRECLVESWGGHIFINMDRDAPPLLEEMFPAAQLLDTIGVKHMRVKWWKEAIINCNWKLAQEAFFEGWHVKQTHPQLYTYNQSETDERDMIAFVYTAFANGHGLFESGDTKESFGGRPGGQDEEVEDLSDFVEFARLLQSGQDAMVLDRDVHIFEGIADKYDSKNPEFAAKAIQALFQYWEGAGMPNPVPDPSAMKLWGGDMFMFPNYTQLPMYGNSLNYRVRPHDDDPEKCRFEVWSVTTYPPGQEPERAELSGRFAVDDEENWGLIPRQDFSNLERMQRGIRSQSLTETRLSEKWEVIIGNMHEELDRRLAKDYGRKPSGRSAR
jgi:phenylpropionate dioxygenase-like ring-hydroxylating dioxygenase large terminal subunit